MKWQLALAKWRTERNISLTDEFFDMITEEITEFQDAESIDERVDALADIIVFTENQSVLEEDVINYNSRLHLDTLTSIQIQGMLEGAIDSYYYGGDNLYTFQRLFTIAASGLEQYGYSVSLVMKETIKEISSRKQDPEQSEDWAVNGPSGKWQKDRQQDEATLYKANYNICKTANAKFN